MGTTPRSPHARYRLLATALVLCGASTTFAQDRDARVGEPPEHIERALLRESAEELAEEAESEPLTLYRNQIIPTDRAMRWGEWLVTPFLSEVVTYDDNVNLTERNQRSDVISTTTLGVSMSRQGVDLSTSVSASIRREEHSRNSELDNTGGSLNATATLVRGDWTASLTESFHRSEDSRSQEPSLDTRRTRIIVARRRTSQTTNRTSARVGYFDGSARYQLSGTYDTAEYGLLSGVDSDDFSVNLLFGRELSPSHSLNVQVAYRSVESDNRGDDFTSLGGFLGFGWQPTPKLSASGRVGYTEEDADSLVPGESEFSGGTGTVGVSWAATPKVRLSADYTRDLFPGTGRGTETIQAVGARVSWAVDPLWSVSGGLSYQTTDPDRGLATDSYGATVGVGFRASDRIQLRLGYDFTREDTERSGRDYDNNRVSLQISFLF